MLKETEPIFIGNFSAKVAGKGEIEKILSDCIQIFNRHIDKQFFTSQNVKIEYFTLTDGVQKFERFCSEYFLSYISDDYYKKEGYIDSFIAQAFVGNDTYGILIRLDCSISCMDCYVILLHELAHIFCIVEEIGGEKFYQKYCANSEEQFMRYGYGLWREFIADYIAYALAPPAFSLSVKELRKEVQRLDNNVAMGKPNTIESAYGVLSAIFRNPTICRADSAERVLEFLEKHLVFPSKERCMHWSKVIKMIHGQIMKNPCWRIEPSFICDLGVSYLLGPLCCYNK